MLTPGRGGAQQAAPLPWLVRGNSARGDDGGLKTAATKTESRRGLDDETFRCASSYLLLHEGDARTGVGASQMRTVCANGEASVMGTISDQVRQVFRRLGRAPLFTIVTLITLGVGVGANTVIFSVLEGVLLKPLPYPHPEQLVAVGHTAPGINIPDMPSGPSNYFIYREQNTTFQDIGLYTGDSVSVTGVAEPEQ